MEDQATEMEWTGRQRLDSVCEPLTLFKSWLANGHEHQAATRLAILFLNRSLQCMQARIDSVVG